MLHTRAPTEVKRLPQPSPDKALHQLVGAPIGNHAERPKMDDSDLAWSSEALTATVWGNVDAPCPPGAWAQSPRGIAPFALREPVSHATIWSMMMRDPGLLNERCIAPDGAHVSWLMFGPGHKHDLVPYPLQVSTELPVSRRTGAICAAMGLPPSNELQGELRSSGGADYCGWYAAMEQASLKLRALRPQQYEDAIVGGGRMMQALSGERVECVRVAGGRLEVGDWAKVVSALQHPRALGVTLDRDGRAFAIAEAQPEGARLFFKLPGISSDFSVVSAPWSALSLRVAAVYWTLPRERPERASHVTEALLRTAVATLAEQCEGLEAAHLELSDRLDAIRWVGSRRRRFESVAQVCQLAEEGTSEERATLTDVLRLALQESALRVLLSARFQVSGMHAQIFVGGERWISAVRCERGAWVLDEAADAPDTLPNLCIRAVTVAQLGRSLQWFLDC